MFSSLHNRTGHYLLLLAVWAVLCLPNLGGPSLWDIDEGNNTEASQEMYVSGNYIVPTFNYKLREDKPVLLYWLQCAAFRIFGINEFSARLPSALAALLTILVAYELGRRMFGLAVGLMTGLILATSLLFSAAAHFANPDALLLLFITLYLTLFWWDYPDGRHRWLYLGSIASGFAVLAKGPVGLVLPVGILGLFLLWERRLDRLFNLHFFGGAFLFTIVAVPWYVWVTLDTKGAWLYGFWFKHNQGRFLSPMENHSGPFVYYLVVLIVGLAPWSIFFTGLIWDSFRSWRNRNATDDTNAQLPQDERTALRFLVCWIGLYFVFFSIARTKLPNYVLPIYPPLAVVIARFLDRWHRGLVTPPAWTRRMSRLGLVLTGVLVGIGLLIAGGAIPIAALKGRIFPGLDQWAYLGILPVLFAVVLWWLQRQQRLRTMTALVVVFSVLFTGLLGGWGATLLEPFKATKALADALPADHTEREVRLGSFGYFQPSLVFYSKREVVKLQSQEEVLAFLQSPIPGYLFVPRKWWDLMEERMPSISRIVAERLDLYKHNKIVLVTNEPESATKVASREN